MMFLFTSMQAWVCTAATDMRRSFDGLIALTRNAIAQEPTSGHLFVFFNRRRDVVKMLYWDGGGFCIWSKRLEEGTFAPVVNSGSPESGSVLLDRAGLLLLLEGIDPSKMKRRKRFQM